ncbi:hypothetical protein CHS0354_025117 [Potamilus streckersoni]|uniref:Multidrug and toxin extrusion protein n=1 Tax=Potamilus streckersoni TaxID=2493646 RepID=A0AAE0SBU0_9BIVA|nr:hypothetical protein CHS0354_025117 [Potamilus streckersoni]
MEVRMDNADANSNNKCSSFFRRIFPAGSWDEFKEILKLSWPIVSALVLTESILMVSLAFCGHLGKEILDSAALAVTVINMSGIGVVNGLVLACDTLFPQTYGSENKTKVGVVFQRSVLILMMCCLPCFAVFLNTEHLLKLIGQNPIIAKKSGLCTKIFISGLPAFVLSEVLTRYLQCQSIVLPSLIIGLLANVVNVVAHAILIIGMNLGIIGASVAVCISLWSVVIFHVIYIIGWKVYRVTWTGFSWECLEDWGQFFSLAVPGMAMRCLEWWSYEIFVFIAGLLGVIQLAGQTVAMVISYMAFMVPYGVSIAASVRVGNNLGANEPAMAALSARISLIIGGLFAVTISVIIVSLRGVLPLVFSNDSDVVMLARNLLLILSLEHLTDAMQCVAGGVLCGCGHQVYGAVMNFFGCYAIALPVAIFLMLRTYLMAAGAWWSMLMGTLFKTIAFLLKILLMDWKKEAQKAQDRAGVEHSELNYLRAQQFEGNVEVSSKELEKSSILKKMDIQDVDRERELLIGQTKLTRKQILFRRSVTFIFFLLSFLAGILSDQFLAGNTDNVACILVNGTSLNSTFILTELENSDKFNLSSSDVLFLNMTSVYEDTHNWNTTFLYCNGKIYNNTNNINRPWTQRLDSLTGLVQPVATKAYG